MGDLEDFLCLAESGMQYCHLQRQRGKMRGCTGATDWVLGNIFMAAGMGGEEAVIREQMESYRSMREEIQELNYKLEHIMEDDTMIGSSTVLDYRSGFPVPNGVVGIDWDRYYRVKNQYENKICILEKKCCDVEEYIENISDSITRRIFRMYFLDGKKQKEIGKIMHMDRSTISKRLNAPVR